ncbi:protein YIPF5-like [Artemia franciscana]|uniref:Protein YIPF n=1 Tax=Artemia franciscana TaxID=6661 RepID=A0AA88HRM8_ARTSF|nr:hypothetical protein QYM36_013392 [Artemia franciscana]
MDKCDNQFYQQELVGEPNQSVYVDQCSYSLDFQSFDYDQANTVNGIYPKRNIQFRPTSLPESKIQDFEDEPPLLKELGINPDHIVQITLGVLNPFKQTDPKILQDTDLAGPLLFGFLFGACLLLLGKLYFSYVYGIGAFGCLGMYCLLNLMKNTGPSLGATISVLGYCLLPMVGLAAMGIVLPLKGLIGFILTGLCVFWCAISSSKLFVTALGMEKQQTLVAYPCALLYGIFGLLVVF